MDSVIFDFIKEHSDVQLTIDRRVALNDCIKFTMIDYLTMSDYHSPVIVRRGIDISMLTQLKDPDNWVLHVLDDMYTEIKDWRAQHGNS